MKPIILTQNEEGQITLTMEEFEKIIDRVYKEGKKDGLLSIPYVSSNFPYTPLKDTFPINWKDYVTCCPSSISKTDNNSSTEDGRFGD